MRKLSVLAAGFFMLSSAGCEAELYGSGPRGLPGEPGEQGPAGPAGPRGLPGKSAMRTGLDVVVSVGDWPVGGSGPVFRAQALCADTGRLLSGSCTWGKSIPTVQPFRAEPITDPETGEPIGFLCEGVPTNVNGEAPMVQAFAVCEDESDGG